MSKLTMYFKDKSPVSIVASKDSVLNMRDELISALHMRKSHLSFTSEVNPVEIIKYRYSDIQ